MDPQKNVPEKIALTRRRDRVVLVVVLLLRSSGPQLSGKTAEWQSAQDTLVLYAL